MGTAGWLEISLFTQCAMDLAVMALMFRRRAFRIFPYVVCLLLTDLAFCAVSIAALFFRHQLHITATQAYPVLFYGGWIATAILLVLRILAVYGVFAEAMRPMTGLHSAGKIIFRWVGVVSALVALALLSGPGAFSGVDAWLNILTHLQQGVGVLTLCLLVFVCFAARPLGLTFRSHLFGVSLGLGISATVELIQAAWLVTTGARSVYSPIFLFASLGMTVALLVWATYFALPEPPRRMILLPTTSPFFFWNRISEILGDSPGHVAVAGFTPDMLAPAEIEMLTASISVERNQPEPLSPEALPPVLEAAPMERPTFAEISASSQPSLAI